MVLLLFLYIKLTFYQYCGISRKSVSLIYLAQTIQPTPYNLV